LLLLLIIYLPVLSFIPGLSTTDIVTLYVWIIMPRRWLETDTGGFVHCGCVAWQVVVWLITVTLINYMTNATFIVT